MPEPLNYRTPPATRRKLRWIDVVMWVAVFLILAVIVADRFAFRLRH